MFSSPSSELSSSLLFFFFDLLRFFFFLPRPDRGSSSSEGDPCFCSSGDLFFCSDGDLSRLLGLRELGRRGDRLLLELGLKRLGDQLEAEDAGDGLDGPRWYCGPFARGT